MVSAGNTCLSNFVFLISRLHWRLPTAVARVGGKGHRSSGDCGSLPPGPCRQVASCQLVEWRCLSCLQKSSFGYIQPLLRYGVMELSLSSSRRVRLNSPYADMTNWCASSVSLAISRGARVPVKILTNSLPFGSKGFVQSLSRRSKMD